MVDQAQRDAARAVAESLRNAINIRFDLHKIPGVAPSISKVQENWAAGLAPLRPGRAGAEKIKFILRELYFSVGEYETALRLALLVSDTDNVKRGYKKRFVDDVEIPMLDWTDVLFWMFVSMASEAMYRVVSRLENLINFCVFGVEENPGPDVARHFSKIVERIRKERPDLVKLKEFKGIEALDKKRQKVAGDRNEDSHWASSVWSLVKVKITESKIMAVQGGQHVNVEVDFPDYPNVLNSLRQRLREIEDPWIVAVVKFLLRAAGTLGDAPSTPKPEPKKNR